MAPREPATDPALEELRAFGLTYPGAHIKSPWPGHADLAVNDKTFAYLSMAGDPFTLSCKLPQSGDDALSLPFTSPTEYGLGKSGWVTARLPSGPVPVELFKSWIDESYRAQAPKRLVASLAAQGGTSAAPAAARSKPAKKRSAETPSGKVSSSKVSSVKKSSVKKSSGKVSSVKKSSVKKSSGKKSSSKVSSVKKSSGKKRPGKKATAKAPASARTRASKKVAAGKKRRAKPTPAARTRRTG